MSVRTGSGGKVDVAPDVAGTPGTYVNLPEVRKWTLTPKIEAKQYASSSTNGAKKRLPGTEDFDLAIEVYVDSTTRPEQLGIKPGLGAWFKLYEDSGEIWVAPAYVDDNPVVVDIEGGEIVSQTINASGNGNITYP